MKSWNWARLDIGNTAPLRITLQLSKSMSVESVKKCKSSLCQFVSNAQYGKTEDLNLNIISEPSSTDNSVLEPAYKTIDVVIEMIGVSFLSSLR